MENDLLVEPLERLSNDSDTSMVYGFFHCGIEEVHDKLLDFGVKVFSFNDSSAFSVKMISHEWSSIRTLCKSTLTSFVIENYFRSLKGEKISPLVFCIDSNKTDFPKLNLSDPKEYLNIKQEELVTVSELRRAYKLCYDQSIDPKIRKVAQETFHFIKVIYDDNDRICGYKKAPAPWDSQELIASEKGSNPKNWRYTVNAAVIDPYSPGSIKASNLS